MIKRVTLQDVARELDMSLTTVSGALNGVPGYAAKTVSKVWEVANRMQYSPNRLARGLRYGEENPLERSRIIMHIIHMNKPVPEHSSELERAVFRLAYESQKRNFFSIPYTYYQLDGFRCPPLLNGYVDGALVGTLHPEVVQAVASKVPTVLMDVPFADAINHISIVNGNWAGGFDHLLEQLCTLGHRRLALLNTCTTEVENDGESLYLKKLRQSAARIRFEIDDAYSFWGNFEPENNDELLMQYLPTLIEGIRKKRVSALFTPNIYYASFLRQRLLEHGIQNPRDISLVAPHTEITPEKEIATLFLDRVKLFNVSLDILTRMLSLKQSESTCALIEPSLLKNQTLGLSPF